jgi:hypothetical protein
MNAEHHFGQPQGERGIVGADSIGAGERKLQAAAQREAVQRRDAGAGKVLELLQDCLAGPHQFVTLSGERIFTNSLMSAPAMKPLALAERITTPAGRCAAMSSSFAARSRTMSGPTARWSRSRRIAHQPGDAVGVDLHQVGQGYRSSCRLPNLAVNGEVANQRQVIGELHVRYLEAIHLESGRCAG